MGCAKPLQLPSRFHGKTQSALILFKDSPTTANASRLPVVSLRTPLSIASRASNNSPNEYGLSLARGANARSTLLHLQPRCYGGGEATEMREMMRTNFSAQILWDLGRCIWRLPGKLWELATAKKSVIEEVEGDVEKVAEYAKKTAIKVEKVAKNVEEVADYVEEGADKLESIVDKIQKSRETIEETVKDMEKSKEKLDKKASSKSKDRKIDDSSDVT